MNKTIKYNKKKHTSRKKTKKRIFRAKTFIKSKTIKLATDSNTNEVLRELQFS